MSNHINYYHYRCAVCSTKYDSLTKEPTGYNEEHLPILHYCPKHQPKPLQPVEQLTPSIPAIEQVIEQPKE